MEGGGGGLFILRTFKLILPPGARLDFTCQQSGTQQEIISWGRRLSNFRYDQSAKGGKNLKEMLHFAVG